MSRHLAFKKENLCIDDCEDDDYEEEEEFSESKFFILVEKIQYIIDELDYKLSEEEIKSLLQKNKMDEYLTLEYLQKNKESILQEKNKNSENKHQIILEKSQQNLQNSKPPSRRNSTTSIDEDYQSKRKISKEIIETIEPIRKQKEPKLIRDLVEYNTQFPEPLKPIQAVKNNHLNLAVVGHVDSGKSTLIGQILYQIKEISESKLRKTQLESQHIKNDSFKFAFLMDSREDEREHGVTIDVSSHTFELGKKVITVLDTPGHKDFVPNMIYGAAQADAAILVVNVQDKFLQQQTKEHALLIKSLGVSQVICALNKMDRIDYTQEQFQFLSSTLVEYLISVGFEEQNIYVQPISGLHCENIVQKSTKMNWWDGSFLLQTIENLELPERDVNKPLRMSINNFFQSNQGKMKGFCICGKIEAGFLERNKTYLIQPHNTPCVVKEILFNNEKVDTARVGASIECSVQIQQNKNTAQGSFVSIGNVLSSVALPCAISQNFEAEILTFDLKYSLLKGSQVVLHINSQRIIGNIVKLLQIIDKKTGNVEKNNPNIKSHQCATVEIKTEKMFCLELYSKVKAFGRIAIREKQDTIAVGVITKIM